MTELVPRPGRAVPATRRSPAPSLLQLARTPAQADRLNLVAAVVDGRGRAACSPRRCWPAAATRRCAATCYLVDGASGVFLALIAVVGLCSALRLARLPAHRAGAAGSAPARSRHWYYAALYAFWGALLAVPIAGNLALAWLLVEATTATSALLIAFTGRRDALEAGWKYLVLTTLGLSVALLGIVVLALGAVRARATAAWARWTGTRWSAAPPTCPRRRRWSRSC